MTGELMSGQVTQITLPDGTPVLARVSDAGSLPRQPDGSAGGYADTGLTDRGLARAAARMESLRSLITGVAASVADGLRAARPDEVSVSFGIELTARAGKVVGLLADGEAKGALTVTLTWRGGPPEDLASGTGGGPGGGTGAA
jgi:hypothetical protein